MAFDNIINTKTNKGKSFKMTKLKSMNIYHFSKSTHLPKKLRMHPFVPMGHKKNSTHPCHTAQSLSIW